MIKHVLFNQKVEVAISEISDGNMRFFGSEGEPEIIKNQAKLGKTLNLTGAEIARIKTIYGDRKNFTDFYEITNENLSKYSIVNPEAQIPVSDGLATKNHNIGILLPLADCLGVVVYDVRQGIIGVLHAGRHNIEQDGPKKFIEYFTYNFDTNPKDLKLYFSPHAINYQIFKLNNKTITKAATEQFLNSGVLLENIINPKTDTATSDKFPSCSNGDANQRFAIIAKQA